MARRTSKAKFDDGNFFGGLMSKIYESYADRQEKV